MGEEILSGRYIWRNNIFVFGLVVFEPVDTDFGVVDWFNRDHHRLWIPDCIESCV